jgi:hypothetical protein
MKKFEFLEAFIELTIANNFPTTVYLCKIQNWIWSGGGKSYPMIFKSGMRKYSYLK